jgi:hypothetical protein
MSEDRTDLCAVCGHEFESDIYNLAGGLAPNAHTKKQCVICTKHIGKSCSIEGKTKLPLSIKEGFICRICAQKEREHIIINKEVISHNLGLTQADFLVKDWLAEADKRLDNRIADMDKRLDSLVKGWLADLDKYTKERMNHFFDALWMMLSFTIFIGIFGLFLYALTQRTIPGPQVLPATFRLGVIALTVIPWFIWFSSALIRSIKNKNDGKGRRFGNYLFGIMGENPIQNIWLPIAVIGTILAILLYAIYKLWT